MTVDVRIAIEQALAEADVRMDVGRFVDLVRNALQTVGQRRAAADPSTQLTEAEVAELRAGGLAPKPSLAAYDQARAQTAADMAALLATALTTAQAAERLQVDASRVRQLLADGQLLAVKDRGGWRILELQFADHDLVPNIGRVVRALPDGLPVLAAANWLASPEPDLELAGKVISPLEWLAAGGSVERVSMLAEDL